MTNKIYNIVCVADENYIQHTAVMLCSLFENNANKNFHVYLLTTGIKTDTEKRLQSLCAQYYATLTCTTYSIKELSYLPIGQWNTIMYLKLLIPKLLPNNIDRCLFLDVDMIINADITPLYNIDLNNEIIAATEDIPDCTKHKQRLGLKQTDIYINSGVIVCNLLKWRELENKKSIIDFTKFISKIITNEQDVIALYFKGNIKLLPIKWNMTTFYFMRKPKIFEKYLPQLKEARKHPGIIHFACPIKPWFKDCQHPYKNLYKRYLAKTVWKNYKFSTYENMTAYGRLKRIIRLFLNKIGIIKDNGYILK
jgi:lipopolysaccharide biosynthesis glycosyltransferase